MTAVIFPLRLRGLAFAICGRRWQTMSMKIKYGVWGILSWECCDFFDKQALIFLRDFSRASKVRKRRWKLTDARIKGVGLVVVHIKA